MNPISVLFATILLIAPPITADAQRSRNDQNQQQQTRESAQDTIRSIDFKGGTLDQLLDQIDEQIDLGSANLVLKGQARQMPVEQLRLRDVTLGSLLSLLVPSDHGYRAADENGDWHFYYYNLEIIQPSPESQGTARPIHVVEYKEQPASDPAEVQIREARSFEIFSLAPIQRDPVRGPYATAIFLDLIETAAALTDQEVPELNFHDPSGMLIAYVTDTQRDLLRSAYESFVQDEVMRQDELSMLRDQLRDTRQDLQSIEAMVEQTGREVDQQHLRIEETTKMIEQGLLPTQEAQAAANKLSQLVGRQDEFKAMLFAEVELLEDLQQRLRVLIPSDSKE